MIIRVHCPGCHTAFNCPPEHLGRRLRCTHCHKTFSVHRAAPPEPPAPPAERHPKRLRRRKPQSLWALVGVGALTVLIVGGSIAVGVAWYKTPSGPPAPPPDRVGGDSGQQPQGYDQVTRGPDGN